MRKLSMALLVLAAMPAGSSFAQSGMGGASAAGGAGSRQNGFSEGPAA